MILLDGSTGEGGGQVLRTALSLSMVTRTPLVIENIRAKRRRPGLMRQHLTALAAAQAICHATVEGGELGSCRLQFTPGPVRGGKYRFAVGTAGSATLVLQTVLPALMIAGEPSELQLSGGTHNPFAPPYPHLAECFLPWINKMGPRVEAELHRPGFYPAGGGEFSVRIEPCSRLAPIDIAARGTIVRRTARILVAGLASGIAERQRELLMQWTTLGSEDIVVEILPNSVGPGNAVVLSLQAEHITEILVGCGEKELSSAAMIERLVKEMRTYISSNAPVGRHLADQLLLPMALAGSGRFVTMPLSSHAQTNIEVIRRFLSVPIVAVSQPDGLAEVQIGR